MKISNHNILSLQSVVFVLASSLVAAFAAPVESSSDIEEIPNSRVGVVNMHTIFDSSVKSSQKVFPRNIESIAWDSTGNRLFIDYQGVNQYFAIADLSSALKGTPKVKILSHSRDKGNTRLNSANPVFHPSDKYYLFSGQDNGVNEYKRSLPGYGFCTNLVAADIQSNIFWPLTAYVSNAKILRGALMPQFSPDGKQLFWTHCETTPAEKSIFGKRTLMLADFKVIANTPQLSNARQIAGDQLDTSFAESYGFSPDGKSLLFAATRKNAAVWYSMDLASFNLETNEIRFLTDRAETWDRYAAFTTTGKKIIWSSSGTYAIPYLGVGGSQWQNEMLSEIWIMTAKGQDRRQITFFNERGNSQYAGCKCYVGMIKWHPTRRNTFAFILHKQHSLNSTSSSIVIAELANKALSGNK